MNKLSTSEIEDYIKRSVVDIARKCGVYNTDIIETFKKLYGNENQFYKGTHDASD